MMPTQVRNRNFLIAVSDFLTKIILKESSFQQTI